jgi:hypothetical protein
MEKKIVDKVKVSRLRQKRDCKVKMTGHDKYYYMDKTGLVYRIRDNVLVARWYNKRTNKLVTFLRQNNGKLRTNYNVELLVARLLLPNPAMATRVGLKDGNPNNCNVNNLYWKNPLVKIIKYRDTGITYRTVQETSLIYGVTRTYIYRELKKPNGRWSWTPIK